MIWKKPDVYIASPALAAGYNNFTVDIFPIESTVTYRLIRGNKVIDEKKTTTMGIKFTGYFKTDIESDDYVEITAKAKGYRDSEVRQKVY